MGGSISKRGRSRQRSTSRSSSSNWYPQYQSPYLPQNQDQGPQGYNGHPSQTYAGGGGGGGHSPEQQRKRQDMKYTRIGDDYNSLDQVTFLCLLIINVWNGFNLRVICVLSIYRICSWVYTEWKCPCFWIQALKFDKQECSGLASFGTIWCFEFNDTYLLFLFIAQIFFKEDCINLRSWGNIVVYLLHVLTHLLTHGSSFLATIHVEQQLVSWHYYIWRMWTLDQCTNLWHYTGDHYLLICFWDILKFFFCFFFFLHIGR